MSDASTFDIYIQNGRGSDLLAVAARLATNTAVMNELTAGLLGMPSTATYAQGAALVLLKGGLAGQ